MRIDAHVHAFPDRLALAVRERLGQRGGLNAGPLLPDVAAEVRRAGFDRAWILPYAHRAGVAESVNEWSAREVRQFAWLEAGATFHPADKEIERLVHRALVELELRVVKLHCSVGAFSPADPRLDPLWRIASERGVPVVTHAGQIHGGNAEPAEVDELEPVLRAFPSLKLVLAHSGYPATDAALALMARFSNLYGDLTPVWDSPVAITLDDFARFPGRFLFGSDAPNNPIPADQQAAALATLVLRLNEQDGVLGQNAARLLPIAG